MAISERPHVWGMIIDGVRSPSVSTETYEDINPSTGEILALVPRGIATDIDRAVEAARRAFEEKAWRQVAPAERGRILLRLAAVIREHAEEFARLESLDNGKPLRQARTDAQVAARYFEFYGGVADKIMGQTIPLAHGYVDFTVREPLGVSAQIVPWNYPLQIGSRGVAPALAAGNTVVLKPSSQAPLTAIRLGELALEAGLPPGVLNVVPGAGAEAGARLASHPGVNQITFTGSVEAGIQVMRMASANVVPVTMELGGKSPNIVFEDADLDEALIGVVNAIYQNAGQTCSAASRLLVQRKVHDRFLEMSVDYVRKMRLGPGIEDPDMGPIISEAQLEEILRYIHLGKRDGVEVVVGGKRPDDERLRRGFFLEPTILDKVSNTMTVAQEEIFGPVLSVITFDHPDEAVAIANESQYGLVAGIWTRDIKKALYLADKISAGQVFINTYGAGGGVELPFGGYKKSGFGREKGLEALFYYTQVKNVCIRFS